MANNSLDFMKDILATPLGELIASIGEGVADAQAALDAGSLAQTLAIYDSDNDGGDETLKKLREIGYQPTFYALPETEVEANVALTLSGSKTDPAGLSVGNNLTKKIVGKTKIYASPLNGSNTNKYNLNVNASTKLRFKIVPVPPVDTISDVRVAPSLFGKTEAEMITLLEELRLGYEIISNSGGGTVLSQSPEGGTLMKIDDIIQVEL